MRLMEKSRGEYQYLDTIMLRHYLSVRYGWSYDEVNRMKFKDAQIAALFGREKSE
jgi:hypothetical protein